MSLGCSAPRRLGPACVAALLLLAGCLPHSFLRNHPNQEFPEHYQTAARVLQVGLGEAGVNTQKKVVGNEIRLIGKTKSEKVFVLYVEPAPTKATDLPRARVTLYWDNGEDPSFWPLVLSVFQRPTGAPADGNQEGGAAPAGG
jgi:hypothetical protein